MPIYEYQCMKCGTRSEFLVRSSDTDDLRCKDCGSAELYKLMSAPNFSLSSSGPTVPESGGCCGAPGSCGSPGSCCSH
ncbi:MAG: Zinc ribbon domain protein [Syntrophorhabdus sp. PtaU1.Bin002]|nr:MAG: Zinc ribbon domain protein [Syntrophorhabdus sp. PtaB.Bin006]OPY64629.1 MAG: Zinc ribbon domain protein [Syntrophorhabdus sp. PtaU1.Bin002]